jgi:small subunit ribosomal protein S20
MANTKQAKKRAAQNVRQKTRNRAVKTRVRNIVRELRATAVSDGAKAKENQPMTASELDVAVRKGVIHARTASRLKSRIAKTVNKANAGR